MAVARLLVAGATGYLGQYLVSQARQEEFWVRALTRSAAKLDHLSDSIDDVFCAEVTQPETLAGLCDGIDYVISSIGITRQKDGLSYMDVDYQANRNLMEQAQSAGVSHFMYVSAFNAHLMPKLKIVEAKERFVTELRSSGLDYTIVRPTGFFSDMLDILKMARKGKVHLVGSGEYRMNPIHGQDLATACLDALKERVPELNIGGPETFSYRQIAEMAFEVLEKQPRISYLPLWANSAIVKLMRLFTSSKTYGPLEFLMNVIGMDNVAPAYGKESLRDFFAANA